MNQSGFYGIRKYKGMDLYKLESHMLDDALLLIKHGISEESDFTSDEPISKIVHSSGTDFVNRLGRYLAQSHRR